MCDLVSYTALTLPTRVTSNPLLATPEAEPLPEVNRKIQTIIYEVNLEVDSEVADAFIADLVPHTRVYIYIYM